VKLGKWSLAVLSIFLIGFFFAQFVLPTFGVASMSAANTFINTSITPDKWTKNETSEVFNISIAVTGGYASSVNLTVPGIGTTANYSINASTVIVPTNWHALFVENYTTPANAPKIINITNTSVTAYLDANSIWINFTATALLNAPATDNSTQHWTLLFAEDNSTTTSTGTVYTAIDSKTPNIDYLVYPQSSSYIYGNTSEPFVVNVNELNLKNATLHWRPYSITGWPSGSNVSMTCTETAPAYTCRANVDLSGTSPGVIQFYYETYDDVSNNAFNGTGSSPLSTTIDRTTPKWTIGTNATNVLSNTEYNLDREYGFQIDWSDNYVISNATIEHNFTGSALNYSATQKSSSTFYYNFTGIPAGYYGYRWFANDSVIYENGNWNVTDQWNFTVAKNTTVIGSLILAFNGTANANKTYTYSEAVNVSANKTISEGNMTLWRDTVEVNNEKQVIKQEIILGNATWNYTLYFNASQNYTTAQITHYVLVNKGNVTINLALNNTEGDVIHTYPDAVNATGWRNSTYLNEGNISLWRNGTIVVSRLTDAMINVSEDILLPNATYNYTLTYTASNYSDASIATRWFTVDKGPTNIVYYINGTSSSSGINKTVGSGQAVNITIYVSNTEGFILLYNDSVLTNTTSGSTMLEYNVTTIRGTPRQEWNISAIYNGSQNYTASSPIWNFLIIESVTPKWSVFSVNYTNNTIIGTTTHLNISAIWNDSINNQNTLSKWWLWSNEIGASGANQTAQPFTVSNNSLYNFSTSAFSANTTFWVKLYANDTSGNENVTDIFMFRIDGTKPVLNTTTPSDGGVIAGTSTELFQVYVYDETLNSTNVTVHWRETDVLSYNDTGFTKCYNRSFLPVAIGGSLPLFICNTTIDLALKIKPIQYYFTATDNSSIIGNVGSASSPLTTTINRNPPQSYNITDNVTTDGNAIGKYDAINISVYWTDDTTLNFAVLETNESGVAANKTADYGSPKALSGKGFWSNFTWRNTSVDKGAFIMTRVFANDTGGNENVTGYINFTTDNAKPVPLAYDANTTNGTTIVRGTVINVSANWTDNVALDKWWIWYNESSIVGMNRTWTTFSATNNSNSTASIDTSSFTRGVAFNVSLYANDTSGNENVTGIWQWTIDGTAPAYGNITSGNSPSVNATEYVYNPGITYYFNASWSDNIALSKVLFEWNGTNQTVLALSDINYTVTKADLGFSNANYTFRWFANDTSTNEAATALRTFNITKNTTEAAVGLSLNGTEANSSYTYPEAVNVTAWRNITEMGNLSLWRNGVIVNSSLEASSVFQEIILGNDTYNFTMTFDATNYTFRNVTDNRFALVNKGNVTINLDLNGTNGDVTYVYPLAVNATGWRNSTFLNEGNLSLWRNGTIYSSKMTNTGNVLEEILLRNATWNYTLTYTASNYSDDSIVNRWFMVTKGISNISLWLNGNEANLTIQRGVSANFTATINTTYNVPFTLNITNVTGYPDNTTTTRSITNVTSTGGIVAGTYNVSAYFNGDQNFTSDIQTWWLDITQDSTGPTVLLYDYTNETYKRAGSSVDLKVYASDTGVGVFGTVNVTLGNTTVSQFTLISGGWYNGTITVPSLDEGNYTIVLNISDTLANVGTNNSYALIIDNTPPIVSILTPANLSYVNGRIWINGTVSDNKLGAGNVTTNSTNFVVNAFSGVNNTAYNITNNTVVANGIISIIVRYNDSAANEGNATVTFYIDNSAPSAVISITNSSLGKYKRNSTQQVQVKVTDSVQTNESITLYYMLWNHTFRNTQMTGTPGTSTTYTAVIDTSDVDVGAGLNGDGLIDIPYYISGVDNATNLIPTSLGGSWYTAATQLANITIHLYCGNNGVALSYCSYDQGWTGFTTGAVRQYHEVHWSTYQLSGTSSLSSNYNISNVLSSIDGKYGFVYYRNYSSTTTPWLSYDPSIAWSSSSLRFGNNTDVVYFINVTAAGTVIRIS